jgi:hypothetical protein
MGKTTKGMLGLSVFWERRQNEVQAQRRMCGFEDRWANDVIYSYEKT